MIRDATDADVDTIAMLLGAHDGDPAVVPRTRADLLRHAGDFLLAVDHDAPSGCVAVHDHGAGRWELLSLAVPPERQRRGLGAQLVEATKHRAREHQARELVAISAQPSFFIAQGFEPVPLASFGLIPLARRSRHVLRQPLARLVAAARLRFVCLRHPLR